MKGNYYINDKDDIFFWFSIIGQLNAKRVLDIGGFYQRIGVLTPKVGNLAVPAGTVIDAVNLLNEPMLPVYYTIYDHIYQVDEFLGCQYDLAIFMTPADEWNVGSVMDVIRKIKPHLGILALDMPSYEMLQDQSFAMPVIQDASVEGRIYKLVS